MRDLYGGPAPNTRRCLVYIEVLRSHRFGQKPAWDPIPGREQQSGRPWGHRTVFVVGSRSGGGRVGVDPQAVPGSQQVNRRGQAVQRLVDLLRFAQHAQIVGETACSSASFPSPRAIPSNVFTNPAKSLLKAMTFSNVVCTPARCLS
jgi:hypothetical protein